MTQLDDEDVVAFTAAPWPCYELAAEGVEAVALLVYAGCARRIGVTHQGPLLGAVHI